MIKLFVSDLDGTLLNKYHMVDETIENGIDKILEKGRCFAIATGRQIHLGDSGVGFEGKKIYRIVMNGALILDQNSELIEYQEIDQEIVKLLLEEFPDVPFEWDSIRNTYVRTSKKVMVNKFKEYVSHLGAIEEKDMEESLGIFDEMHKRYLFEVDASTILSQTILKVNCRLDKEKDAENIAKLNAFIEKHQEKIVNAPFSDNSFELTQKGVNKGEAVKRLLNILKIGEDEVAVYGDGENDVEMLSCFPNSYAPENACTKAKEAAGAVIGMNEEYSVIYHMLHTL